MGLFDFIKICLFSEVNGVVTMNGKPVAGAEVIRTSEIGDSKVFTDKTVTDNEGRYHFPARFARSLYKIAPVEPLIEQKIVFLHQGKEHLGWNMNKHNYEIDGELNRPIQLSCELSEEPKIRLGARYAVRGVCTGEGILDEIQMKSK